MISFLVVEFTDDSVDVVPSCWLDGNVCFWPPYRGLRFTAAVKKQEKPGELWSRNSARVIELCGQFYPHACWQLLIV